MLCSSSRRADFLRLANALHTADPDVVPHLAAAAFGLYAANHFGVLANDTADPVATSTSWWDAPRAPIPVSIRERGDTTNRGRPTPLVDRSVEQEFVRRRRDAERRSRERVDAELLAVGSLDGALLSMQAMTRFQQLLGRSSHRAVAGSGQREVTDGGLYCVVRRSVGTRTVVQCPEGVLSMLDVEVSITVANGPIGSGHG